MEPRHRSTKRDSVIKFRVSCVEGEQIRLQAELEHARRGTTKAFNLSQSIRDLALSESAWQGWSIRQHLRQLTDHTVALYQLSSSIDHPQLATRLNSLLEDLRALAEDVAHGHRQSQ